MSKVNYAIVFSSRKYKDLIYKTLERNDVMFVEPINDDEKSISEYVKKETAELGNYDSIIIDLGAVKDTDEQIMEAIEAIRFLDDKMRIIVLEGTRLNSENLFRQCFLNGIYNLVSAQDFIQTKEKLEQCLLEGMTFKDSLVYRDAEMVRSQKKAKETAAEYHGYKVGFLGSEKRIGTTHCVLSTAYTLRKSGYMVAVVDYTNGKDYVDIMQSYGSPLNYDGQFINVPGFQIDEIDFYIHPDEEEHVKETGGSYNFILYDFGSCVSEECQNIYDITSEKILVLGSKPWELTNVSDLLSSAVHSSGKIQYLFNLTNPELQKDLLKMMSDAGIKENIFFMEYLSDFFSTSEVIKGMFQLVPKKEKKKWFGKRG